MSKVYSRNELNEKLKAKEAAEALQKQSSENGENKTIALDDSQRVKVLSPTRLVVKRFLKNTLAIIGLCILIFMFVMCFMGPIFYPYGQTQKFKKIDKLQLNYSVTSRVHDFKQYVVYDGTDTDIAELKRYLDSYVKDLDVSGETTLVKSIKDKKYVIEKLSDKVVKVSFAGTETLTEIATVDTILEEVKGDGLADEFKAAILSAISEKGESFEYEGVNYILKYPSKSSAKVTKVEFEEANIDYIVATKLNFDSAKTGVSIPDGFAVKTLLAVFDKTDSDYIANEESGKKEFTFDGTVYSYAFKEGGEIDIFRNAEEYAYISEFKTTDISGDDTLDLDYKKHMASLVAELEKDPSHNSSFEWDVPQLDSKTGKYEKDENGLPILYRENLTVTRKETSGDVYYYSGFPTNKELISIYERPSWEHILGTDGDGYDVFARVLFGGRVSLLVGFVVVLIETFLGVILGGISGFFGGWVDTLIMRLVDIFYCIPTMPILIIIASVFDYYQLNSYVRLFWMMVILGILGWSGIARLVRGQILSLREQEFMIAAEATGLRTSRRIFRHLVPNVMPQLIVSMTMGLGSVILTESTLSFLGLGVKHPLATWGNMINSVSTIEAMREYTYIWIPVGILICLTVIAFNFVGDGLRDAFDPKMKR